MREKYELNVLLTFLGTAEKISHEEKYGQTFKVRDFLFYVPQENFILCFSTYEERTRKINNSVCLMAVTDKIKKNRRLIHGSFQSFAIFNVCPRSSS